jgi:hypothetical protein
MEQRAKDLADGTGPGFGFGRPDGGDRAHAGGGTGSFGATD